MSTFLDKWLRIKKSGTFHRKRKRNLMKTSLLKQQPIEATTGVSFEGPDLVLTHKHDDDLTFSSGNESSIAQNHEIIEVDGDDKEIRDNWLLELSSGDNLIDDDDDESKNLSFRKDLQIWANTFKIKHNALKNLMTVINNRLPNTLPKDPRTFLRTPPVINTIWKIGNGQYWHQGFLTCLEKIFSFNINCPTAISININIDGLPIYNNGRDEFWPILFNIFEIPELKPMIIGIYWGKGKPTDLNGFLQHFVEEMKPILEEGIFINNNKVTVKIRSFICDSPARAFVKGVANFNSQNGCQKCTVEGEYSYVSHCNYFPLRSYDKRTDSGFRNKDYGDHHKYDSPLLQLPIDMVKDFPIGDSLHLIDLGITKRLLIGWRDGNFGNYRTKWSARNIEEISGFLLQCKMPVEIHRSPRGLDVLAHWKALEFRTFLYYIGVVVLKYHLPNDIYEHFLVFFCAITFCSSSKYKNCLNLVQTLLDYFVEMYAEIYGEYHINSNVHNLTHLADDVKRFGPLHTFSAYPFESKLYTIKNTIRSGNNPLAQVAKRLGELSRIEVPVISPKRNETNFILKIPFDSTIINDQGGDDERYFCKLILPNFSLGIKEEDKWFLSFSNDVILVKYFVQKGERVFICGSKLKEIKSFFVNPITSTHLHIYASTCATDDALVQYTLNQVQCKLVAIKDSYKNVTVFIPLLHTL